MAVRPTPSMLCVPDVGRKGLASLTYAFNTGSGRSQSITACEHCNTVGAAATKRVFEAASSVHTEQCANEREAVCTGRKDSTREALSPPDSETEVLPKSTKCAGRTNVGASMAPPREHSQEYRRNAVPLLLVSALAPLFERIGHSFACTPTSEAIANVYARARSNNPTS